MPDETQESQFSNEEFNSSKSAKEKEQGARAILDAALEEVFESVLSSADVRAAGVDGRAISPVETFNFSATGAIAPVTGVVPGADPVVFELDTFVAPREREELSGLESSFSFTANALDQTSSEFATLIRGEESASEERIVWLVVLNPIQPGKEFGSNGIRDQVKLTEEVLDDLPGRIYKRLPDGDYQIYLQEAGESQESRKLIIEIRIRDGKPADVEDKPKLPRKPAAEEEAPVENENQKPDDANEEAGSDADGKDENAQAAPRAAGREVSSVQPASLQDDAWAAWAARGTSGESSNSTAEEGQAVQRTAGLTSVAALAVGGSLLALNKDGNWRKEIDESMAHWENRRKRRPR